MSNNFNRRRFLQTAAIAATGVIVANPTISSAVSKSELFKISLAEWSVHNAIFGEVLKKGWDAFGKALHEDFDSIERNAKMTNLDFPVFARKLGIEAVEYVNTCFFNKAQNEKYLKELNKICDSEGIKNVLIMCDAEGTVGHPDKKEREKTANNHKKWIDAAAFLGCHSIRVNAGSSGSFEEQQKLAADGLRLICEYGETKGINIIVENHGGYSSNADWLVGVMELTDHKRIGTLPDFGNFKIKEDEWYDRYKGVKMLMPYAKGVSAKSNAFDADGNETKSDYVKLLNIVKEAGYRGYVGIEYEGAELGEKEGILATKKLLEKVREQLA